LLNICKTDKYINNVRDILKIYISHIPKGNISVAEFDYPHIKTLIESNFMPNKLENGILAEGLVEFYKRINIPYRKIVLNQL